MAPAWNRRRSAAPHYDQTFGDKALSAACEDMVMGRWEGAHDLLATGPHKDWDRRSHRIRLLAHTAADKRIVEAWQTAQPNSADAVVLRADTEVMRLFAAARTGALPGSDSLDRTAHICLNASEAFPEDPHPWVSLITLGRLYGSGTHSMNRWWPELLARDRYHREAHHQALRYMSARWHGTHGQAYAFARDCAVYAPAGSPLLVMPQIARAEEFRHRTETEGARPHTMVGYWAGERWDLLETMERWIAVRSPIEGAQDVADLNHLAHGLAHAGLLVEAATVFDLLKGRATRAPWSYTGDAEAEYMRWRERASRAAAEQTDPRKG
ncbi:hypothetical protein OG735_38755 [Streptomyces sp. NBC_01210]|uniref:hypothetical protein n=1 Tax=Streptomyces sp. NBC_01210 TaxID=2903774 RepID=UPI002E0EE578|nr:hypothetical protein OG735_38755 [Streptomyces sp. NBC_01210]